MGLGESAFRVLSIFFKKMIRHQTTAQNSQFCAVVDATSTADHCAELTILRSGSSHVATCFSNGCCGDIPLRRLKLRFCAVVGEICRVGTAHHYPGCGGQCPPYSFCAKLRLGAVNCAMCAPWRSSNCDVGSLCNHGGYGIFQLRQLDCKLAQLTPWCEQFVRR